MSDRAVVIDRDPLHATNDRPVRGRWWCGCDGCLAARARPRSTVTCHGGCELEPVEAVQGRCGRPRATLPRRSRARRRRDRPAACRRRTDYETRDCRPVSSVPRSSKLPLVDRQAGALELGERERSVLAASDVTQESRSSFDPELNLVARLTGGLTAFRSDRRSLSTASLTPAVDVVKTCEGGWPGSARTAPVGSGHVLEIDALVRTYGSVRALDGMSFTVRPGAVTGFLGPNGAGKTTTMRAIFGLTALDAGEPCAGRAAPSTPTSAGASATSPRSAGCTRRCGSATSCATSASCAASTRPRPTRRADGVARAPRPRRPGAQQPRGPVARQPATHPADQRPRPRARRADPRRAVLRTRPDRRRRAVEDPRVRGSPRRHGAVLVAPTRPRRAPVRGRRDRRPRAGCGPGPARRARRRPRPGAR